VYVIELSESKRSVYGRSTLFIVPSKFILFDTKKGINSAEEFELNQIIFYEGQSVFVGECLTGIEIFEYPLTSGDITYRKQLKKDLDDQKKQKELDIEQQRIKRERERISNLISKINEGFIFDADELSSPPSVSFSHDKNHIKEL